eukprot:6790145-Prorocentrum_lima.AAC.1
MTSSLVGSEMCIRDRWKTVGVSVERYLPGWLPAWWQPGWRSVLPTPWTVSYTHLTLPTICSV